MVRFYSRGRGDPILPGFADISFRGDHIVEFCQILFTNFFLHIFSRSELVCSSGKMMRIGIKFLLTNIFRPDPWIFEVWIIIHPGKVDDFLKKDVDRGYSCSASVIK